MSKEFPLSSSPHGGSSSTTGSSQDGDVMLKIRGEISRLQMLERGLAKSSRSFTVKVDEEERLETRNTRVRRGVSVLVGLALLVGVVFGITAIAKYMKSKDVQFAQGSGGNTPTSLQELEVHNTVEDCWLILHGNVYDLSSYADRHPGGAYWITDQCGREGTELYDVFHPTSLLKTVARFQIGPFVENTAEESSLEPGGDVGNSDAPTGSPGSSQQNENELENSTEHENENEHDSNENEYAEEGGTPAVGGDDGQQVTTVQPTLPPTQAPVAQPPQEVDYSVCRPNCSVPLSELQRHDTANDLWMAVYGVVYDLTDYFSRHPGGSQVVVQVAGTVMTTNEFERYHKARDVQKVTQYIVGNLA
jgi:cytochrome b involved in lipid metabolism